MKKFTIIGIDGGATKVSAWEIQHNEFTHTFTLGEFHSEKKYSDIPGWLADFLPVDIKTQLSEKENGQVVPTTAEKQQASVYVEACAVAIEEIVQQTGQKNILIGLGMPGLKTAGKRGIEVVANGPRMTDYSDMLEKRLHSVNINLTAPIYQIGSDADYCGIGENHASDGAFVDCQNAYYLGGGTGVADALKLNGKLVPLDTTKEWLAKTWELKSAEGKSLERYCSSNGIQSIYAELSGIEQSELTRQEIFPPQIAEKANEKEPAAVDTFKQVSEHLARVIYSRITSLACGWQNDFGFVNPARPELSQSHPYLGSVFEKLILGQRLGDLFHSEVAQFVFKKPLLERLKEQIETSTVLNSQTKEHYNRIENLIVVSKLREAPALGAGVDAFQNYQKYQSN